MKNFIFVTSMGIVTCTVDTNKPLVSTDPEFPDYVCSEGEIVILDGKERLDKLYLWDNLRLKDGWIKVDLDDGCYGCPEYKVIY